MIEAIIVISYNNGSGDCTAKFYYAPYIIAGREVVIDTSYDKKFKRLLERFENKLKKDKIEYRKEMLQEI